MKTEAEIIQMGVDEVLEREKNCARYEEIKEQIKSLEAEMKALDTESCYELKWREYLAQWQEDLAKKIRCAVEQANDGGDPKLPPLS